MLSEKIKRDLTIVDPILARAPYDVTPAECMQLLNIYQTSFHKNGKIEGVLSLDSSCHGCNFCKYMRGAAEKDPRIICGKCYDYKQEQYKTNVKDRHILNMRIMSSVLFFVDELKTIPAAEIVRINSSGDINNLLHARNMIRYAYAHKFSNIAIWSKNFDIMTKAFNMEGKPANLIYIASAPLINIPLEKLPEYADFQFVVYDSAEKIAAAINDGAAECNGKKCRDCGYKCYSGHHILTGKKIIAELLRK